MTAQSASERPWSLTGYGREGPTGRATEPWPLAMMSVPRLRGHESMRATSHSLDANSIFKRPILVTLESRRILVENRSSRLNHATGSSSSHFVSSRAAVSRMLSRPCKVRFVGSDDRRPRKHGTRRVGFGTSLVTNRLWLRRVYGVCHPAVRQTVCR